MTPTLIASYDYCRALAKRTAKNFYYSFLTLPRDRFRDMCVLYAFMRVTDDLGDNDEPLEKRRADLAAWRDRLLVACEGAPCDHPVLPAVADIVHRYAIPVKYLMDVIRGVEMDLRPVTFETFAELADYCYHVAGAVGLSCIHLWGFHDERALGAAVDCGTALQLTNILRDLREDAAMGRIYLPQEDLERFEFTGDDLARGCRDERFRQLMHFEVTRTEEYYAKARALFEYLDPPGKPILETMLRIYGGLLEKIRDAGYDVFSRRVELSGYRKLCIAGGVLVRHKVRRLFARG